jgi:hypothetical protein
MRPNLGVMLALASMATLDAAPSAREMSLEPPPLPDTAKRDTFVSPYGRSRGAGRAAGRAFLERNQRRRGRR